MDDLELEDDPVEMQAGGFTPGKIVGSNVAGQFNPQPIFGTFPAPIMPTPFPPQQPSLMPKQAEVPTMDPGSVPKFQDFIKAEEGTAPENREYINPETGEKRFFTFIGGKSTVDIPDGFIPISQYKPEEKKPVVQPTTAPVQQQESDGPTDAERKDQFERETRIKERKAAAYELGYTKEADPLKEAGKFLLGALIPGGGLLAGMDKPEKGTIMPDGSIADGEGNTFDPRTGEQLAGKGILGFGKSAAEKSLSGPAFDALSEEEKAAARAGQLAVPESSLAGLRSLAGEDSIKDLLASLPEEVKVASTTMAGAGKTAGEAAKVDDPTSKLPQIPGDPFSDPRKAGKAVSKAADPSTMIPQVSGTLAGATSPERAAGAGTFQPSGITSPEKTAGAGDFQPKRDTRLSPGALGGRAEPTQTDRALQRDTRLSPGAMGGRIERRSPGALGGRASERDTQLQAVATRKNKITSRLDAAKKKDPKQFRKDVKSGKYNAEYAKIDRKEKMKTLFVTLGPIKLA